VIPVHTVHPERFVELVGRDVSVRLPEVGVPLSLP